MATKILNTLKSECYENIEKVRLKDERSGGGGGSPALEKTVYPLPFNC